MTTATLAKPVNSSQTKRLSLNGNARQGSLTQRLTAIKDRSTKITPFVESASLEIAETFNAVFALLEFESNGTTIVREFIKDELDTTELAAIASNLSIETQLDEKTHSQLVENLLIVTAPLNTDEQNSSGAFSVYLPLKNPEMKNKLTNSIERTIDWMMEAAKDFRVAAPKSETSDSKFYSTLQKATRFENLTHLCFGLANNYCEKLGCQKVVIGLLSKDGLKVELKAVSGMDQIKATSPNMIQIQQAQEECLDVGHSVCIYADDDLSNRTTSNYLIHRQWHTNAAGSSVASVPIKDEDKFIGVASFQREQNQPFDTEELEKIERSISGFVPAIHLMKKAQRSLKQHFLEDYVDYVPSLLRESWAFKLCTLSLLVFLFGWLPYRPTMTCNIEPGSMSRLVAPFDGVLKSVEHLPGDEVKAGDIVFRFDSRQLETERHGLEAQIKAKSVQRDHALTLRETAQAKVIDAEVHVLETQLESLNHKIEKCSLRSSLDGHLVRGDLRPEVGQTIPNGTPLAEIAPIHEMKLNIHIPESLATRVETGASGYFVAESNPREQHPFKIKRITPSTRVIDGRNVILAEAEFSGASDWMRSGMQGYAKIDAGWSPIIWIVGHDFWNSLRLGFWL